MGRNSPRLSPTLVLSIKLLCLCHLATTAINNYEELETKIPWYVNWAYHNLV